MSIANNAKWLSGMAVAAATLAADILYFSGGDSLLYRILAAVGGALVAFFILLQTAQGAALWKLFGEARTEIRRVVWPTYTETTQTSFFVIVFVLLFGVLLWGLDSLFGWLASWVIG